MSIESDRAAASPERALAEALAAFRPDPASARPPAVQKAVFLARRLQTRALQLITPRERQHLDEIHRMIQSPEDKATIVRMTDETFRPRRASRSAEHLVHILDENGIPKFLSPFERQLMRGFQTFGEYLPSLSIPLVKEKIRSASSDVVLAAENDALVAHLRERQQEGLRMNVNYLGEALLDEREALHRLEKYLEALQVPEIEFISIKISTLYSQIAPLAREETVRVLCDRLELLYRAAVREAYVRPDGVRTTKAVYLDMEEHRDMEITAEAFTRTLDRRGMESVRAGIALQAYLPDAFAMQKRLNAWARARAARGGSPVLIRIVKGANMEMERVQASLEGWPQPPFHRKIETDANFKRMLHEGLRPDTLAAVHLGIASHNLFDLAYALVRAHDDGALDRVQFEMLEGMANHQRRALSELTRNILLYAPACRKDEYLYAIGYLVRRLDENTGPDNFLSHAMGVEVGSPDWEALEQGFLRSFDRIDALPEAPRSRQDRSRPPEPAPAPARWQDFENEPNTNFSLPQNEAWIRRLVEEEKARCGAAAPEIPLVVDGETLLEGRPVRECRDPSRPGIVVGRYRPAEADDVERALACAAADPDGWRSLGAIDRLGVLWRAADALRAARGDLLAAALADGGKTIPESDPEVSEAVDFAAFYPLTALDLANRPNLSTRGRGVVVVASPWNFPLAIPCGGVAAALAAGNTVILKPSSDAVRAAHAVCECFWRAGVSRRVLQFVPCPGGRGGRRLVTDPRVDAVILTGGTETAVRMLQAKPGLRLLAETGGKNATIVTALADRDLAIKHVLHSAFSHAGQKCSATSLLILEKEVYDDPEFKRRLVDAAASLPVGSAWDLATRMGPLIRAPEGALERGLKELEPGESWALLPRCLQNNPALWSPGIKWNVRRGSFTHTTELFGPVLAVLRAETIREAIDIANETGYGLTAGLESLDDREQVLWINSLRAGNLYVNRGTTGAVVLRQPFGGLGLSAFGPGIKAGGPHYVIPLMEIRDAAPPPSTDDLRNPHLEALRDLLRGDGSALPAGDVDRTLAAIGSYALSFQEEFSCKHDPVRLVGQDNFRRYLPVRSVAVRLHPDDAPFDVLARVAAALTIGCRVRVSASAGIRPECVDLLRRWQPRLGDLLSVRVEDDDALARDVTGGEVERVRTAAPGRAGAAILRLVPQTGLYIADAPVLMEGRVELLWYVREQSVCIDYHRYGNLGRRAGEPRRPVL